MNENSSAPRITVPKQKLTSLSFCEPNVKQMEQWVSELPMANIGETAKRLYHALIEINQLILAPNIRFQLMEVVRNPVYFICKELSKHFLNHSIVLPEKQRKIANLTQALQLHLANGYKLVIHDQMSKINSKKTIRALAPACHRAISDLACCVVRSCQLYCQSPPNVWLEIHQIFKFAHELKIDSVRVKDTQLSLQDETSIAHTYKRIALLGCSKPNQMRQNDIALVYNSYEAWAEEVELDYGKDSRGLFISNPAHDSPPYYRSLHSGTPVSDAIGLDTAVLVDKMTDYLACLNQHIKPPSGGLPMPVRIADNVLASLSKALGILTSRTFKRLSSNDRIFLTAGLSSAHYFSAGGVDFHVMLMRQDEGHDANYHLTRAQKSDVWSSSFDSSPSTGQSTPDMSPINFKGMSGNSDTDTKRKYIQHTVPLVDTSPGGYCLQWSGEVPGNIQAGGLLGLREQKNQPLSIAVIRWIKQIKQHRTHFGAELLASNAIPCGVQLTPKTGDSSEFLRGLLLPEQPSIGQPTTLITPRLPFQVGHKCMLNNNGHNSQIQLSRRVLATGSFSQFEIKFLSQSMQQIQSEQKSNKPGEDDFNSLWPTL